MSRITASPIGARRRRRPAAPWPAPGATTPRDDATSSQNGTPPASEASGVSQATGVEQASAQLDSSTVLPAPAGATTSVTGAASSSSRSNSRARRTWWRGRAGTRSFNNRRRGAPSRRCSSTSCIWPPSSAPAGGRAEGRDSRAPAGPTRARPTQCGTGTGAVRTSNGPPSLARRATMLAHERTARTPGPIAAPLGRARQRRDVRLRARPRRPAADPRRGRARPAWVGSW